MEHQYVKQDRTLLREARRVSPGVNPFQQVMQLDQSPSRQELEMLRQKKCELLQQSLNKLKGSDQKQQQQQQQYNQQNITRDTAASYALEDLKREIERLKRSLFDMSQEVEQWRSRCHLLENQITDQNENKQLRQQMQINEEMLHEEIVRLKTALEENHLQFKQIEHDFNNRHQQAIRDSENKINQLQHELERTQVILQQKQEELLDEKEKVMKLENNTIPRLQNQLKEVIQDHNSQNEDLQHLTQQQKELKEEYDNLIVKLENIIEILKAKFQTDLRDLQTKMNIYFNQNNAIKMSLNQNKESQHLIQLIQQYSDNSVQQANNQAKLKQVQDEKRAIKSQLNQIKEQSSKKQNKIDQLTSENQELLKKLERYKPRIHHQNKLNPQKDEQPLQPQIVVNLQETLIAKLEGDIQILTTKLKQSTVTIDQLNLVNAAFDDDIKRLQAQIVLTQQNLSHKEQLIFDLQKQHKNEIDKVHKDFNNLQNKIVSDDKLHQLQEQLEHRDHQIKELQAEVVRKRELTQQFKNDKENTEQTLEQLRREIQQLNEENEKFKKEKKEISRRDQIHKDMKEKYEQKKTLDKSQQEEIAQLQEKLKAMKADVQRKEQLIKELREKLEEHHFALASSDKKDLKPKIKKLKEELALKETALKHFKQKFEKKSEEYDQLRGDWSIKQSQMQNDIDRESRRAEQGRVLVKKQENHINMLVFLLKRLYRENVNQLNQVKHVTRSNAKTSTSALSHYQQSRANLSRFSESMNILGMSPDDLQDFLEPNSRSDAHIKKPQAHSEEQDQFDEMLGNLDALDINKPFAMLQSVIQERFDLTRN